MAITLRYLATGNTFRDLRYYTRIAANTISIIVRETLDAIITVLGNKIQLPSTKEDWERVAQNFETSWQFPHCIGSVDGKHVNFRPPRKEGSKYRNYKGTDSIVLLALVGADYTFLFVDIGRNGRMHDSKVFRSCPLGTRMESNSLNLPDPCELPGFPFELPYVFVGDDAFSLRQNFLKPYPARGMTLERRIYNYRLCRARRVVENAFGILANRWRVLLETIPLNVETVEKIVYVCVLLHNYLLSKNAAKWYAKKAKGIRLKSVPRSKYRQSNEALAIRNRFCEYFNSEGAPIFS